MRATGCWSPMLNAQRSMKVRRLPSRGNVALASVPMIIGWKPMPRCGQQRGYGHDSECFLALSSSRFAAPYSSAAPTPADETADEPLSAAVDRHGYKPA